MNSRDVFDIELLSQVPRLGYGYNISSEERNEIVAPPFKLSRIVMRIRLGIYFMVLIPSKCESNQRLLGQRYLLIIV